MSNNKSQLFIYTYTVYVGECVCVCMRAGVQVYVHFFWLDAYCCSLIECVIWDWLQSKLNLAFGELLPVFEIQAVFFTRQYLLVCERNIVVWRFNNQCYFVQLCKMYMLWLLICGAFQHQEQSVNINYSGTSDNLKPYTSLR